MIFPMAFWKSNIQRKGRVIRLYMGIVFIAGAVLLWLVLKMPLAAVIAGLLGAFALFEAIRGWCLLRACKLKTPW